MKMNSEILIKDLNELLCCRLCAGYFKDAHTIPECMHTFCKSCILKHFNDKKNLRAPVFCPTCNFNLGLYTSISSKLIYDRDIQSIVDKIFPGLGPAEYFEEVNFYNQRGIKRKLNTEKQEKMSHSPGKSSRSEIRKDGVTLQANISGVIKDDERKYRCTVGATPCTQCIESLRLPALTKKIFEATSSIKLSKVQKFIFKRLSEEVQKELSSSDNIDILLNGNELLSAGSGEDLQCIREEVDACNLNQKDTHVHLTYRKKV